MDDFLYILRIRLEEELPSDIIRSQIQLYENYINEELSSGKTIDMVMRKLGDPTVIAEKIIEQQRERHIKENEKIRNGVNTSLEEAERINALIQNPSHGIKAEFKENEGWDIRIGKLKLNSWYGTVLILVIVVLIATLVKHFGG